MSEGGRQAPGPAQAAPTTRDEIGAATAPISSDADPYLQLARSRLGRVVRGKWRLDALLGVGGMAAVYAATHRNGSRAALKMLHPMVANEQAKRRFLREGYLANRVAHPGVAPVLDDDEAEDGSIFLVMELLEGESLETYASRRIRIPAADALAIGEQVLDVLVAAHARGIIHRDVKPENVFLCLDGRVKLLDFGVARLHELSRASTGTHHGFLLGTPTYMAPEQARGDWEIVDGRTDVWSVGASLFRVLTGRTVHQGRSHLDVLLEAGTKPAPRVRDVHPEVPELVASLVDRALAFDMNDRWSSAAVMLESLRAVYAAMGYPPASKLRAKIAADATVRMDLPTTSVTAQEIEVAAPQDDVPTRVAAAPVDARAHLRSTSLDVEVDVEIADPAPPMRSGIQESAGRELPSIFDETGESTVAMAQPPAHLRAEMADASSTEPDGPHAPCAVAAPVRRHLDRTAFALWSFAVLAVLLLLVALLWRFAA